MGTPAFLKDLTDAQREAVLHDGGPLVVLAGPGAGKTHVIVRRIARLVAPVEAGGAGVEPESVLALAFTVKAAEQLRERLAGFVGPSLAERVQARTSHGFGRRLLVRFGDLIGLRGAGERRMMDSAQRRRLVREIVQHRGLLRVDAALGVEAAVDRGLDFIRRCATDAVTPARIHAWIAERESRVRSGDHAMDAEALEAETARLAIDRDLAQVFDAYERTRRERSQLTIDDCIIATIRLLEESRTASSIVREEIRHVVVDEFQDWNPAQIRMLALLAPPGDGDRRGPDVCVVGDDDQAIFAFRGADERAFERFKGVWRSPRVVALEENFRSQAPIVRAADRIMSRARARFDPGKKLVSRAKQSIGPAGVEGVEVEDVHQQGGAIGALLLADRAGHPGRAWGSYAVVCRTNTDVDRITSALELLGVPVAERAESAPVHDPGVVDLLAWARLVVDRTRPGEAERLLVRPPLLLPVEELERWLAERRAKAAETSFVEWMTEARADHPAARGMVQRLDHMRAFGRVHDAASTLREAVRVCDLVHAEALTGAGRAARLRAVVQVLKFAGEVQANLPAPGSLAELLDYYDDLDDDERTLLGVGRDPIEDDGASERRKGADAVEVLTAHRAKGLEFDTVIVAQVWPQHGFPKTSRSGRDEEFEPLPRELTGRAEHVPLEEERRIFYVACTRAARRLVLIGKRRERKATSSTDYFLELTHEDAELLSIPVSSADVWLARADPLAPAREPELPGATSGPTLRWIDAEAARTKRALAQLAHAAESPGASVGDIEGAGDGLRLAVRRLATLASVRAMVESGRPIEAPAFLAADAPDAPDAAELRTIVDRCATSESGEPMVRPMTPPLYLSYSRVHDYEACPRCFYVKNVMQLDEPKTAELAVGDLAHRALHAFYAKWRERDADGRPLEGEEGLRALLRAGEEALRGTPGALGREAAGARAQLEALLENYWRTLHIPSADVRHLEQTTRVELALAGSSQRLTAKIDRLDQLPDGRWRVIDYKTGRASDRLLKPRADDLQMGVYLLALPALLGLDPDEQVEGVAEYWMLQTGERGAIDLSKLKREKVLERLSKAVEGMLAGRFEKGKECKGLCAILGEM